jgi:hypothetical protein
LSSWNRDESSTLELIQTELRKVISKGKAPGVLRLAFHDAGTFNITKLSGGMNGSIVYELERPENAGLKRSIKVFWTFSLWFVWLQIVTLDARELASLFSDMGFVG